MIKIASGLIIAFGLSACASQVGYYDFYSDDANMVFGQSVKQNIAAQTVNPDGSDADVEANGARVGKANDAYRADKVEKPRSTGTTVSVKQSNQGGGQGGQSSPN
ncbi:MAG TPA: hypothetical protein VNH64_06500 [Parvularculaceae bacterium]|nr:hypothetical protein [Parvularculaceae bacterium]